MKGFRAAVLLCAVLLMYCGYSASAETTGQSTGLEGITAENYPRVDGSTATLPLSQAVYRLATGSSQQEADEKIVHTKTTNSYLQLIAGECDLLIVADKNEKVDEAIAQSGVELEICPIALDAFIFMTNEDNPVKSLTKEQVVGIYAGEITSWAQVGGEEKSIIPFQRNENAGSQTAMKSLVMQGREMTDPEELRIYTMSDLLEAVASYNNEANALGYSYYYYASLMYRTPGLRFMAVDGVMPSNETVQDGSYPYIAGYYAVIRKAEGDTPARQVFNWLQGRAGQELMADLGYVPVDRDVSLPAIHADETAAGPLPIGEDECIAVVTGKTTLTFLDREGRVMRRMANAALGGNSEDIVEGPAVRIEVLKKDEPVLVMVMRTLEESESQEYYSRVPFLAGAYLPSEDRFTIEPSYYELNTLGNGLVTDGSVATGYGSLMRADGSIVSGTEGRIYRGAGEYVIGMAYDEDRTDIYSADGAFLFTVDGNFRFVTDRGFLVQTGDFCSCYDTAGNLVWRFEPGYYPRDVFGEYIDWNNTAQSISRITDLELNEVLNAGIFAEVNRDAGIADESVFLEAVSPDGSKWLLNGSMYYLCDRDFRVLERFSKEEICMEWPSYTGSGTGKRPWQVYLKDGFCTLRDLFGTRIVRFSCDESPIGRPEQGSAVACYGEVIAVWLSSDSGFQNTLALIAGGEASFWQNVYFAGEAVSGTVRLRDYNDANLYWDVSAEDGTVLPSDSSTVTVYDKNGLKGVIRGSYLYLEDENGELYLRLLAEDEG